jgi:hypothetical protein
MANERYVSVVAIFNQASLPPPLRGKGGMALVAEAH